MHSTLLFAYFAAPELGMHTLTRTDYMPPAGLTAGETTHNICIKIQQTTVVAVTGYNKRHHSGASIPIGQGGHVPPQYL